MLPPRAKSRFAAVASWALDIPVMNNHPLKVLLGGGHSGRMPECPLGFGNLFYSGLADLPVDAESSEA
jgi:hypothetical protein